MGRREMKVGGGGGAEVLRAVGAAEAAVAVRLEVAAIGEEPRAEAEEARELPRKEESLIEKCLRPLHTKGRTQVTNRLTIIL